MSFFGGGTDMPEFFNTYGGSVLSTTFDKYCYVNVKHLPRFFDYSSEVVYSRIERVASIEDIEHPAVRNAMKMLSMRELRVAYEADLPARTGLGTSSSFAVGMLNAFHCLKGQYASKGMLAKEAIHLERALCSESGGWQDQVAAAFGGLNRIDFENDSFDVSPIIINPKRKAALNESLMLFFTGFTRMSSEIQKSNHYDRTDELKEMLSLVDEAESVLVDKNASLHRFGELLDHTWKLKRGLGNKVSTEAIDGFYDKALNAGATGGKLLGAGGGGFLLFYAEPDAQKSVISALPELLNIPFTFEDGGTSVIHYSPEDFESMPEEHSVCN